MKLDNSGLSFAGASLATLLFLAPAARPQLADVTIEAKDGATEITATSPYTAGTCTVKISGVPAKDKDGKDAQCQFDKNGKITIALDPMHALAAHQLVQLMITPQGGLAPREIAKEVEESLKVEIDSVRDGDTSVSGRVLGSDVTNVCVDVLSGDDVVQHIDATFDAKKNTFSANLTKIAVEDQTIHVDLYRQKNKDKTAASCSSPDAVPAPAQNFTAVVRSAGYDWGRVKLYFTLGALWTRQTTQSQSPASQPTTTPQTSFGSLTGYLSANLDYNWYTRHAGPRSPCFTNEERKNTGNVRLANIDDKNKKEMTDVDKMTRVCHSNDFIWMLNTYADARLTQIPLSTNNTPASGASTPGASTTGTTANVSQFQGGYFEGGVYIPLMPTWTQWTYRGQNNALFVAPLGKFGFQGFGSGANGVSDTSPSVANPTISEVNRFYAGGVRIGHFRMPQDTKSAGPELLSYVDFTSGIWNNFRERSGVVGTHFDVTGRLKVPSTLFYLGFDVNVGPAGDYMAIFAGTRLDVGSLLGKLIPTAK